MQQKICKPSQVVVLQLHTFNMQYYIVTYTQQNSDIIKFLCFWDSHQLYVVKRPIIFSFIFLLENFMVGHLINPCFI